MPLPQTLIDKAADVMLEWAQGATDKMINNLNTRLKQKSQVSQLAESIVFDGTKVDSNGITLSWNLNDYWMFVDLGVKGTQNRAKTYGNYAFKNLHVSTGFIKSMEDYITRKGIKVRQPDDTNSAESKASILDRRHAMAFAMAKAIKKKGIDGTRFYSDVFNDNEFKKLTGKLSDALGQEIEIRIIDSLTI